MGLLVFMNDLKKDYKCMIKSQDFKAVTQIFLSFLFVFAVFCNPNKHFGQFYLFVALLSFWI